MDYRGPGESCLARRWSRCRSRIHARSRIGAVRSRSQGCRARRSRSRGHRALRIQQMIVARPEPQADQGARVGHFLRLPAVVGLIPPHRVFTRLIPRTGRFAAQVMFAYQRFLNGLRPLRLNLLLASRCLALAILARARVLRLAAVSPSGRTSFWMRTCRSMRCGMSLGLTG